MKKFICFIACFFVLINNCSALDLSCPEVVSPGEVITVKVNSNDYNGIKVKYNFGDKFVYQDMIFNSPWKSYYDSSKGFVMGNVKNSDALSLDIRLKTAMDIEINKEYILELVEISASNSNYNSIDLDNVFCKVMSVADINTLDSLEVDNVTLSPKFNKNITSYEGSTKRDKVNIKVVASDDGANVEGDIGEQYLDVGVNVFSIKVTSIRGNEREYKVYIIREVDKKSSDITLKSLKLTDVNLKFNKNTFIYYVDVEYDVSDMGVYAVANDSKASVKINNPNVLDVGENTIEVIVTAEDGTKGKYVIVVNRRDKLSDDSTIKELNIKNYDINFKSDIFNYVLKIDDDESLDIDVVLNNEKAKYNIIGNDKLHDGSIIKIEVVAEDGSSNIYTINIVKKISNVESNSSSFVNFVKIVPIILVITLICIILIIKLIKSITFKKSKFN